MKKDSTFSFVYQPIVRLSDFYVHSYEALVRFDDLEAFETQGQILDLEEKGGVCFFDAKALAQLSKILSSGDILYGRNLNLNISAQSISDESFLPDIRRFLADCSNPSRFTFELTETAPISDMDAAMSLALLIHRQFASLSLDDYGAGCSTAKRFLSLPFHGLKLDGSLIRSWHESAIARDRVIKAVALAKGLKANTTAEFISSSHDVDMARSLGIDFGQGFYFGRPQANPVNPDELTESIRSSFKTGDNEPFSPIVLTD